MVNRPVYQLDRSRASLPEHLIQMLFKAALLIALPVAVF